MKGVAEIQMSWARKQAPPYGAIPSDCRVPVVQNNNPLVLTPIKIPLNELTSYDHKRLYATRQ